MSESTVPLVHRPTAPRRSASIGQRRVDDFTGRGRSSPMHRWASGHDHRASVLCRDSSIGISNESFGVNAVVIETAGRQYELRRCRRARPWTILADRILFDAARSTVWLRIFTACCAIGSGRVWSIDFVSTTDCSRSTPRPPASSPAARRRWTGRSSGLSRSSPPGSVARPSELCYRRRTRSRSEDRAFVLSRSRAADRFWRFFAVISRCPPRSSRRQSRGRMSPCREPLRDGRAPRARASPAASERDFSARSSARSDQKTRTKVASASRAAVTRSRGKPAAQPTRSIESAWSDALADPTPRPARPALIGGS